MKKYFTILLLSIYCLTYSQNKKLSLSVKIISDEKIETIEFRNFRGSIMRSFSNDTKLNFENDVEEEYFLMVKTKENQYRKRLWLDKGEIGIKAILQSKKLNIIIDGSDLFDKTLEYQNGLKSLISKKSDNKTITQFLFKELKKNIGNPFSYSIGLNILFKNQNNKETLSQLMSLLNSQDETVKSHYTSDLLFKTLKSRLYTGNINISDFKFLNIKDKENEISFANNDFILIDFWHTACPPCIKDHIKMKELLNNFKEKKTNLISISSDKGNRIDTWKKYLKSKELPWTNYLEKESNGLTENLNIRIFPTYILLNKKNDIVIYTNSLDEILLKLNIGK